jgi:hypothetical protein
VDDLPDRACPARRAPATPRTPSGRAAIPGSRRRSREPGSGNADVDRRINADDRSGSAAALKLVEGLRALLTVTYVPLGVSVARLDTTTPAWLLELDSDSSAEDQCWAMIDVLRVMGRGAPAARFAMTSRWLRLVGS